VFTLIPLLIFVMLLCLLGYSSLRLKALQIKIQASEKRLSGVETALALRTSNLGEVTAKLKRAIDIGQRGYLLDATYPKM
jgi:sensor domain CHASE-containing protein